MTLQPVVHEYKRQRIQEVAREYRKQGYEVVIEPTQSQLPPFLASFQIDMLARNTEENVIIEVRTHGSLTDTPKLDAIAKAIQGKPGWRFDLVVSNPRDRDSVYFKDATSLDLSGIDSRLADAVELLYILEYGEAALLLAWSATEALLRYIANVEVIQVVGHEPSQVIKSLFTHGVINKEQYQVLQHSLNIRNLVVHGYKEYDSIVDTFEKLLNVANRLKSWYKQHPFGLNSL